MTDEAVDGITGAVEDEETPGEETGDVFTGLLLEDGGLPLGPEALDAGKLDPGAFVVGLGDPKGTKLVVIDGALEVAGTEGLDEPALFDIAGKEGLGEPAFLVVGGGTTDGDVTFGVVLGGGMVLFGTLTVTYLYLSNVNMTSAGKGDSLLGQDLYRS